MSNPSNFSQFCDFLLIESEAISAAASKLDAAEVSNAVAILEACQGKVVLRGVGKSGHIAQKIAGTLTSTGTPAIYLHPSDAVHGGLGIVRDNDVVLALSNSGETEEIIALLPNIKQRGVPLIAIVGNLKSTLARHSDCCLDATVDKEACPLNLAPTTSTTVALAIGDALALTLMQQKGLTEGEFAQNHPAGRLGKRLTLRVADLMHAGKDNPVLGTNATWIEVVTAITKGGLGAVNVVDMDGILTGVITDGDLRRALQRTENQSLAALSAEMIMTRNPIVALPDLLAFDALRLMEDRPSQISVLPVIDGDRICVGLLRLHDVVRSGL